jgi:hypothetical protein
VISIPAFKVNTLAALPAVLESKCLPVNGPFAEVHFVRSQVDPANEELVVDAYRSAGLSVASVGSVTDSSDISISVGSTQQIAGRILCTRKALLYRDEAAACCPQEAHIFYQQPNADRNAALLLLCMVKSAEVSAELVCVQILFADQWTTC